MSTLPPSTWTEAVEMSQLTPQRMAQLSASPDGSAWRRQIGPGLALQGKDGGTPGARLVAIDLEHDGEAIIRFRPGQPPLVRPFTRARYSDRQETTPRRLALINSALPAPLVSMTLEGGHLVATVRLDVPGWTDRYGAPARHGARFQLDLAPAADWMDVDAWRPAGFTWPASTWS